MKRLFTLLALLATGPALADIAVVGTPNADVDSGDSYTCETGSDRACVWVNASRLLSTLHDLQSGFHVAGFRG